MKRIIEDKDANGLDQLLGETVLLMCGNYFYTGKLTGVNDSFVELEDASIVYETGEWTAKQWKDAQKIGPKKWNVQRGFIESFGLAK